VSDTTTIKVPERDTTYNGWENYETWATKLWIDNDGYAGGADTVSAEAKFCVRANPLDADTATNQLAQWIEDAIDQDIDNADDEALTTGLWADLLGRSLGQVNWHEIARAYIDECIAEGE